LFSRWLEVVVGLVLGLALLVKNNTGDFTIVVVASEADGYRTLGFASYTWRSGESDGCLSGLVRFLSIWLNSEVGAKLGADFRVDGSRFSRVESGDGLGGWETLSSVTNDSCLVDDGPDSLETTSA